MARKIIDQTAQEDLRLTLSKVNDNFVDLYASVGTGDASVTSLTSSGLVTGASVKVDTGTKTATASAGAATLNKSSGIITTEALTTAAGSDYTLTLTNSAIAAGDIPMVSIDSNGSAGLPDVYSAKCTANTLTVIIRNTHASAAFNAALKVAFVIFKA